MSVCLCAYMCAHLQMRERERERIKNKKSVKTGWLTLPHILKFTLRSEATPELLATPHGDWKGSGEVFSHPHSQALALTFSCVKILFRTLLLKGQCIFLKYTIPLYLIIWVFLLSSLLDDSQLLCDSPLSS